MSNLITTLASQVTILALVWRTGTPPLMRLVITPLAAFVALTTIGQMVSTVIAN
jgi:hypothetical protein